MHRLANGKRNCMVYMIDVPACNREPPRDVLRGHGLACAAPTMPRGHRLSVSRQISRNYGRLLDQVRGARCCFN
jgi:hypothetical protein